MHPGWKGGKGWGGVKVASKKNIKGLFTIFYSQYNQKGEGQSMLYIIFILKLGFLKGSKWKTEKDEIASNGYLKLNV